eukprot:m.158757 g.158757  ORF g.158757 m.158757 type:complete len:345 (-) comp9831_c0_seq5:359-1393(-)
MYTPLQSPASPSAISEDHLRAAVQEFLRHTPRVPVVVAHAVRAAPESNWLERPKMELGWWVRFDIEPCKDAPALLDILIIEVSCSHAHANGVQEMTSQIGVWAHTSNVFVRQGTDALSPLRFRGKAPDVAVAYTTAGVPKDVVPRFVAELYTSSTTPLQMRALGMHYFVSQPLVRAVLMVRVHACPSDAGGATWVAHAVLWTRAGLGAVPPTFLKAWQFGYGTLDQNASERTQFQEDLLPAGSALPPVPSADHWLVYTPSAADLRRTGAFTGPTVPHAYPGSQPPTPRVDIPACTMLHLITPLPRNESLSQDLVRDFQLQLDEVLRGVANGVVRGKKWPRQPFF